ncbi:aconitate hydratase 1 [Neorickettsia risticii str. Illinois]|uniref:Aconitate hydratase n=1 Tax=Neorickettsia risticii (strain Illinois) TaxID=434131 RepID=C6V584_NEORI|nr:aconitate hydratase AcnA [Neorickettsia risticii]ACT69560.1 aconitate hydratase 1 [Neorickettsia risticii str. Illinois]
MKKKLKSKISYFDIKLEESVTSLPCVIKILIENALRNRQKDSIVRALCHYKQHIGNLAVDYYPSRVLMQDFTGVPAIVDLAALRDAVSEAQGDPRSVNPKIPVDLVIDHSIQVDSYGKASSATENKTIEFQKNIERYKLLKWAQKSFQNFRVVPPGTGICHQVNLEYLAQVVRTERQETEVLAYPDTLVGTDSHTTMSGGLSVLGWGVGGIEAESVVLGEPISMVIPEVIGLKLEGKLKAGLTATDLVLHITHLLRKHKVVGKFVEVFGDGVKNLSVADRATIANMAPECGSTCNFFAPDQKTLDYLDLTGKTQEQIDLVEDYTKSQTMWADYARATDFVDVIELDLSEVRTTLAGPKRPQDKISLHLVPENFNKVCTRSEKKVETSPAPDEECVQIPQTSVGIGADSPKLQNGSIVIAAITSCTNTSNPSGMIAAGLLAKRAVQSGLQVKNWVKTSLAPGSQVVSEYLKQSGLQDYLDQLGFNIVGFGCTTCIGNSGELKEEISEEIDEKDLVVVSVLSGNRNFEGRIHPKVKANYLASPMLVVAYGIAGNININLESQPLGYDKTGKAVYLRDITPSDDEIDAYVHRFLRKEIFLSKYQDVFLGDRNWQQLECTSSVTYKWDENCTYIKSPPFFKSDGQVSFQDIIPKINEKVDHQPAAFDISVRDARILAVFGDSITTDHISPAGTIPVKSPAGEYLKTLGVTPQQFNSYGARRGNHEIMIRGTFANTRIKNKMLENVEGGYTTHFNRDGRREIVSIYEAAMRYKSSGTNLVIFAGKEYGTGSSRDWAAKGTYLLGVKAVIAESFERIHRSNLVGMGVLPLVYSDPEEYGRLTLTGEEIVTIELEGDPSPMCKMECQIINKTGLTERLALTLMVTTEKEMGYIKVGNILKYVLKESFLEQKH